MEPDLQSSLICDDVRQEVNGKFMLIGLFDSINVVKLPEVIPRLCVVTRWCCGEGEFMQRSRIVHESGAVAIEGRNIPVKLQVSESTVSSLEFFMNVRFENAGVYWVEVLLNDDLKIRYPIRVLLNKQGGRPNPPPPSMS